MQNKLLSPLSNGFNTKASLPDLNLSLFSFLFSLFIFMLFLLPPTRACAGSNPINEAISAHLDFQAQKLTAEASITVPPHTNVQFDLTGLTVQRIKLNGEDNNGTRFADDLIPIEATSFEQTLVVHYEIDCKASKQQTCGINQESAVFTDQWHPIPNKDVLFSLTTTAPEHFEVISEADFIQSFIEAGKKTTNFSFPHPTRTIHLIAGSYDLVEEDFGNNQVIASYFFPEDKELAQSYRQKAKEYLERYIEQIGPYPYQRFSVVENRFPTGYAMPTFTLLGQSVVRLPFIVNTSLGHEVLHSWFGNAVRVDKNTGNWCEGLVTYLADQSYAAEKGEDIDYRKNQLIKYQSYVHKDTAIALNEFSGSNLSGTLQQETIRAIGYNKSSMVFHMLKVMLGKEKFIQGLQDFFKRMNGKIATWHDIQVSFENIASTNLDTFFSHWLTRKDIPYITLKDIQVEEEGGQLQLSFQLDQQTESPYSINVPIVITTETEQIEKSVSVSEKTTNVSWPLNHYPLSMVIDPHYDLIRVLDPSEMPPVWQQFSGAEKKLAVVSSPSNFDLFEPLIDTLEATGTTILAADEVTDDDLMNNAVLFLGTDGAVSRGLFGPSKQKGEGFVLDARKNPLNHKGIAILADTSSRQETQKALKKLRHYKKYSLLHFQNGKVVTKTQTLSTSGQLYYLDEHPLGVAANNALDLQDIIKPLLKNRVIYVGESHTRYKDHKMQLRVIRELFLHKPNIAIGMEMFPRSAQESLDRFIQGETDEKSFLKESKYFQVWSYDYRLYREILSFARRNKIPVIGLNIEKDKVSKVYKEGGIASLSPEEKSTIPIDRDLSMPSYRQRLQFVYSIHPTHGGKSQFATFLQAQAIWDETMADSVVNYLNEHPSDSMVVLAGKAHVIKENAIPPRVYRRLPVAQSIILCSDGGALYPPEVDYVLFPPHAALPQAPVMGIMMKKENDQVIIDGLAENKPAEKSGVEKGDILLSLDDEPISSVEDVKIIMLFKKKGESIQLTVRRPHTIFPDEELSFELTL